MWGAEGGGRAGGPGSPIDECKEVAKENVRGQSPISIGAGDSLDMASQSSVLKIELASQRKGPPCPRWHVAANNNRILCIPVPFSRSRKQWNVGGGEIGEGAQRPGPTSADGGGSVEWDWLVGSKQSHQAAAAGRGGHPKQEVGTDPGGWLLGSASRAAASPLWLPFLPGWEAQVGVGP